MPPGAIAGLCLAGFLILFTPIGGAQKSSGSSGKKMTDQGLIQEAQRRGLTK